MKFLNLEGLTHLVNGIKNLVKSSAENTLKSSKAYTDENINNVNEKIKLTKNQILDPDNYGTLSTETGGVISANFEPGSISNSTGEDKEEEGYYRTPFIPLDNNKFTLYTDMPISSSIRTFVYDADKNWISTANDVGFYRIGNGEKANITNMAKYIKCRVGTTATSGTLTVTFDTNNAVHQKVYFNNGYNMESTLIEDNLYQLQVNAEEDEFNIFTIAAPKNNASEATLSLMLNDEEKTQFVDLSCMKYHEDEDGYFCTILQSRGDTPLPRYVLGFNDGKGAGRVRKLEIEPDAVPMQFVSNGIRVRKDNTYDNNWTDDNSVVVNLAELANAEENANAYTDTKLASKSDVSHTHNYAGSSSPGGAATTALNCTGNSATATRADKAIAANGSVFGIPNNGSENAEGGELEIANQDGTYWALDSLSNDFRIFDSTGQVHFTCIKGNPNNSYFYGKSKSATSSNYMSGWVDDRHTNTTPNDYSAKFEVKGLKTNEAIGYPDGSTYSTVAGLRAWHDSSGGNAHEFAFTGNGEVYQRHGSTDTWGAWNKVYTSQNMTYGTGELTVGSSYLATGNFYFQYE